MTSILDYTLPELEAYFKEIGESSFRAKQIYDWIYDKRIFSFSEMTNLSVALREKLEQNFSLKLPEIIEQRVAKDGTIKLLLKMEDGSKVETALMPYDYGNAICVSSEVGCSMGCAFCASGLFRKVRGLEVHELLGQVLVMDQILDERGEDRVSHIVIMGTGEPFDNYDNCLKFLKIANDPKALNIGARHLTLSTCGLTEGILRYKDEKLPLNLAISLHAPNDEKRKQIMPIARKISLDELLSALKEYQKVAGRRITIEYILIKDFNDSIEDAIELTKLLKDIFCYVNLIPINPVTEKNFMRPSNNQVHRFRDALNERGLKATIRKEFGTDIEAACGQLRAKYERIKA